MSSATTSASFFEEKYKRTSDPWDFASSEYELQRYAAIVASLQPLAFQMAFEAGCSIGVLTRQLAEFCESVYALDVSTTAVKQAIDRCRDLTNVDIRVGSLLTDMPDASFNLIVLSEIGYYFTPEELASIGKEMVQRLQPGGVLLGAHWLGYSEDHRLTGDEVHELIGDLPDLDLTFSARHDLYRIDHWRRI